MPSTCCVGNAAQQVWSTMLDTVQTVCCRAVWPQSAGGNERLESPRPIADATPRDLCLDIAVRKRTTYIHLIARPLNVRHIIPGQGNSFEVTGIVGKVCC